MMHRNRVRSDRDRNRLRLLFYSALCVSATIIVVSTILYIQFEGVLRRQISAESANHLNQVSYSAKIMNDSARLLANQLYRDPLIGRLMFYSEHDRVPLNTSLNQLSAYRRSMPFVHSVYIYNGNAGVFYVASAAAANSIQPQSITYDDEVLRMIERWEEHQYFKPIAREIHVPAPGRAGMHPDQVFTFLMYTERLPNRTPSSAIVLNLSHAWMHETIVGLRDDPSASVVVLDAEYRPVLTTEKAMVRFGEAMPAISEAVRRLPPSTASTVVEHGSLRAFVTSVRSDHTDWVFLSIRPYRMITSQLRPLRAGTTIISAIILVLGTALTLVFSTKAYKPIREELQTLTRRFAHESNRSVNLARHQYLRSLLEDGLVRASDVRVEANRMLSDLQVPVDLTRDVCVLLVSVDNHHDFSRIHSLAQQSQIKQHIRELCDRVFAPLSCSPAFEVADDNIAILANTDGATPAGARRSLGPPIAELQTAVRELTPCAVSVFAAVDKANRKTSVADVYRELRDVSFVRIVEESECVIVYEGEPPTERREYRYSHQQESVLIDHLMEDRPEEALDELRAMLRESARSSYTSMIVAMQRVALAVDAALRTTAENGGPEIRIGIDTFVKRLGKAETLSDVEALFSELFSVVSTGLANRQQAKHDRLVARVEALVAEHYANPLFCAADIAQHVMMSSGYLGRLFKRETGHSLAKYINEVRLREAEARLESTDETVSAIAASCGFSSDVYFYKVFKKHRRVTPTEYRERHHCTAAGGLVESA